MDSNVDQDNIFKEKAKDVRGQDQRFSSLRSSTVFEDPILVMDLYYKSALFTTKSVFEKLRKLASIK